MATLSSSRKSIRQTQYQWEGKDRSGRIVRGEMIANGTAQVRTQLRRQGIIASKVRKMRKRAGRKIKPKDIALFTRQLSTMMKAGVPLLQAFDIVGRGNNNVSMSKLIANIRDDIESGSSLSSAFRKHPLYFNALYCNLIEAGEEAGILEELLDRLSTYLEKTESIKSKVRSALMYPIAVIIVAAIVVTLIMLFVIPAFKDVFVSFGADLPLPTLLVIAISEFFVNWWWALLIFGAGGIYFFMQAWKRSEKVQSFMDRALLKFPIFGALIEKSSIARWTRTLSTMFAAGVPLVESLDSVGGASGNIVYEQATYKIQNEVATGTGLASAMTGVGVFPHMVVQMTAIGEESGSLDLMLGKAADFYEEEVDQTVARLSSLLEPVIIVFLGVIIGGIVVAMYLPIFKLGAVVGG